MRRPIIAGNWKMFKTLDESVAFVQDLAPHLSSYTGIDKVVAPTFIAVAAVSAALADSEIKVSAQQVHWEDSGAYTSQIAPSMLKGLVDYVIIGHSECRAYLNETDETVNKKTLSALKNGLKPIVAVGESLEQYEAGQTEAVVRGQVTAALQNVSEADMPEVVIAYEPIWAIGTGRNASAEIAQGVCGMIRAVVAELYGSSVADAVRIQYGGSVKPENMLEYMSEPDIDGALVGGASLKVDSFTDLIRIAAQAKGV